MALLEKLGLGDLGGLVFNDFLGSDAWEARDANVLFNRFRGQLRPQIVFRFYSGDAKSKETGLGRRTKNKYLVLQVSCKEHAKC